MKKRPAKQPPKYTATPVNGGARSALLVGLETKVVFVDPDHAKLAARVAELLNRHGDGLKPKGTKP